jgi:hypothetical protein
MFRALLPSRAPAAPQRDEARQLRGVDILSQVGATAGPHGGVLLRVRALLNGLAATCLIDCGASADFVSLAFVERHGLTGDLEPTDRRVRGYDGNVVQAAGTLLAPLDLVSAKGAGSVCEDVHLQREFIVAPLHSVDVVLGLPWLASVNPEIRFRARTVHVPCGDKWRRIPLAEDAVDGCAAVPGVEDDGRAATMQLVASVNALYDDDGRGKEAPSPQKDGTLDALLRTPAAAAPQGMREEPALVALRAKLTGEFKDVFPEELPAGLPPGRDHELKIELVDGSRPPARVPPRINAKHSAYEAKWLKEMLAKGLIRPSQSAYAAPHFYVDKADTPVTGDYRAVTDYRALNALTVKNRYPLPRADTLFERLAHAKYFTKIDLRTGFYQILIAERDRHKTAFTTGSGLFEYNVLPMGLCNSPAVFMQLMNDTFRDQLNKTVLVFLDDIIVFSESIEEHERHVRWALQRLRAQRLYAKMSKSALCVREVEFLGHYVSGDGLRVMQDKVDAVSAWPVPQNISELRAFLGLAGYYRRFVRDFSAIALPLTELTRTLSTRKLAAHWGTRQQLAFVQLKRSLQEAPVLTLPDPARPFVVHCDASGYAVGAVLQQDRGKGLQPVAYMSRKMNGAETRYPVHEQELLAIIEALTAWRHHLQGASHPVTVRTDHKSLEHFQTQPMLSGRQTRWLDTLALFDYRIEYVKGPDNSAADALSRRGDHAGAGGATERPPAFVDDRRTFVMHCIWTKGSDELAEELHRIGVEERRGGRTRTLAVQREREEARRAATCLVPAAEVDSPPPNRDGARVTATQRCTADNRSGAQCACRTARGQYCWVHQRATEGTRIKAATVPAAGKGLFAAREFAAGEHIADYSGDEALLRSAADGGPYYLALTQRRAIDAARTNSGYGRWANDPRGSGSGPNAEFVINRGTGTGRLRSTRRIAPGDEVLVSYGPAYWKAFGPNAPVPLRPAPREGGPREALHGDREVIDLTQVSVRGDAGRAAQDGASAAGDQPQVGAYGGSGGPLVAPVEDTTSRAGGVSVFSEDLAREFAAACIADEKYAFRLKQGRARTEEAGRPVVLVARDQRLFNADTGALVVPKDAALRTRLMRECHDAAATGGHLGREKTVAQMQRRFYWRGMTDDISSYVRTCDACQKNKPSQQRTPGELMPIASPDTAAHTWTMDLITTLPVSRRGNDAIVVWVDKLTKLRHYAACRTKISAPELAQLFMHTVVRVHGMPSVLISDRDPRFTAHFWKAFWGSMGTTLNMSTAFHPQTDGQTENANRTLETMLRASVDFDQTDWDDMLPAAELAANNAKHATTGYTPYYLHYGREARMPLDLAIAPLTGVGDNPAAAEATARWRRALQTAKENTATAQRRQKKYADRRRRALTFKVGDRVLVATEHLTLLGEQRRTRKFTERYIGPYRVKRVVNANAYELELPAQLRIHPTINVSRLKEYHDGGVLFPHRPAPLTRPGPEAAEDNGAPVWEVARLLDHRKHGRRKVVQYLVEWRGYPLSEATWEPLEHLGDAMDAVRDYNARKGVDLVVNTGEMRPAAPATGQPQLPRAADTRSWATVAAPATRAAPAVRAPAPASARRTGPVLRGLSTSSQRRGGCNGATRARITTRSTPTSGQPTLMQLCTMACQWMQSKAMGNGAGGANSIRGYEDKGEADQPTN